MKPRAGGRLSDIASEEGPAAGDQPVKFRTKKRGSVVQALAGARERPGQGGRILLARPGRVQWFVIRTPACRLTRCAHQSSCHHGPARSDVGSRLGAVRDAAEGWGSITTASKTAQ